MTRSQKVLIAYDGSTFANAALSDLKGAGLGPTVQARLITAAHPWQPSLEAFSVATDVFLGGAYAMVRPDTGSPLKDAKALAEKGAERLRKLFPDWKVSATAALDSPAHAVVTEAEKWNPSLVVLGSLGHSALGQFFLGSVSHKVLTHASCNVRIARPRSTKAAKGPRILVAVDGSTDSDVMANRIAARSWGKDAEFRVVVVVDFRLSMLHDFQSRVKGIASLPDRIAKSVVSRLEKRGLRVTSVVKEGDPRSELEAEARRFKATTLFVGSRGLGAVGRFFLGSVSTYLAEHAPCTVEVDRR